MKKAILITFLIAMVLLSFGCSKSEEKLKVLTLYEGPDTTKPVFEDPPHIIHITISGDFDREQVANAGIETLKQYIEKNPGMKRANLAIHTDTTNFVRRRPEVRVAYYGTGEPHVEVNRWPSRK